MLVRGGAAAEGTRDYAVLADGGRSIPSGAAATPETAQPVARDERYWFGTGYRLAADAACDFFRSRLLPTGVPPRIATPIATPAPPETAKDPRFGGLSISKPG